MDELPLEPVEYFSFGGQSDINVSLKKSMDTFNLSKALRRSIKSSHCDEIVEFAPVNRFEGDYSWPWFTRGLSRLRRNYKRKQITIDLSISRDDWSNHDMSWLRLRLSSLIIRAFELFIERLKKDKAVVNETALMDDVIDGIAEYLKAPKHIKNKKEWVRKKVATFEEKEGKPELDKH